MYGMRLSIPVAVAGVVLWSASVSAGIEDIKTAVRCANHCVGALSGASGCEDGIGACEEALWKHMAMAAQDEAASASSKAFVKSVPDVRPGWVEKVPVSEKFLFGVGTGRDVSSAFARAAAVIASQIKVDVNTSFEITTTVHEARTEVNGGVSESSQYRQKAKEGVSTTAGGIISGIVIAGNWVDYEETHHVLASLDLEEFKKNKAIASEQMGIAIFEAARSVVNGVEGRNAIGPQELAGWDGHIEYLKGRVADGDDEESVWKKEFIDLQTGIAQLLRCIEPVSTTKGPGRLISEGKNRLAFVCKGRPWVDTRLNLEPVGGLVDMPQFVNTDGSGSAMVTIGAAYGKEIHIQIQSDGIDKLKSLKVMWKKSGIPARLPLTGRILNGSTDLIVKGSTWAEAAGLKDALTSVVTKFWAGTVTGSRPVLEMIANVTFGEPVSLGDKYNVPCNLSIAVREIGSEKLLFQYKFKTAAMGETVDKAKASAINNLAPLVRKVK